MCENDRLVTSLIHCSGVYTCAVYEAQDLMLTDMPYRVVTSSSFKDYGVFDRVKFCTTKLEAMEVFGEETFDFIEWRKSRDDLTDDQLVVFDRLRSVCVNEPALAADCKPVMPEGFHHRGFAGEGVGEAASPILSINELHTDALPTDNGLWDVLNKHMAEMAEKEAAEHMAAKKALSEREAEPSVEESSANMSLSEAIHKALSDLYKSASDARPPRVEAFVYGVPINQRSA